MAEPHERTLLATQGFAELGMLDDALAELDTLPLNARRLRPALELRTAILMQAKRWPDALVASRELLAAGPENNSGYIHVAFCLHELGHTAEARDTLLSGPESLRQDATFHYNLACYECALGALNLARAHLEKSFKIDKRFREFARTDPDLKALQQ